MTTERNDVVMGAAKEWQGGWAVSRPWKFGGFEKMDS
jgi:hypothetical protein